MLGLEVEKKARMEIRVLQENGVRNLTSLGQEVREASRYLEEYFGAVTFR